MYEVFTQDEFIDLHQDIEDIFDLLQLSFVKKDWNGIALATADLAGFLGRLETEFPYLTNEGEDEE